MIMWTFIFRFWNEYPQTINAISKGRRGINPALSIKLGHALGTNEEYFMLLQAYYEVERERKELLKNQAKSDLSKIRTILFVGHRYKPD